MFDDEKHEPILATDDEISEAGERRREAMQAAGVRSYRQLRAQDNGGKDKPEVRGEQVFTMPGVPRPFPGQSGALIKVGPPKTEDAFDLASFLPLGRDIPWDQFVELGIAADRISREQFNQKVSAEGLLTILRANGAVTAYGIPVTVRRLPRPESKQVSSRSRFVPLESVEKPATTSDVAQLRAQVARLEQLVLRLESGE